MTELVRHHAGNFIVGARGLEHATIQEHRTARERKRVDVALVHDIKRVSERWLTKTRRHSSDEPRANALDQVLSRPIVQHRKFLPHLPGRLAPELNVLRRRKAVSPWLDSRLGRKRGADQKRRDREQPAMMTSSVASHTAPVCKQGTTRHTLISQ